MAVISYNATNLPTTRDILQTWCFGLPMWNPETRQPMSDPDIQRFINGAIRQVERRLSVFLKPTKIAHNAVARGLRKGIDYDVEEPPYDYSANAYRQYGFIQLRQRPVQSIDNFQMVLPNGQLIVDFLQRPEWIKLNKEAGQVQIVPYAGDPTLFLLLGGTQAGYPFITGAINSNLPHMFQIDYTVGLGEYDPLLEKYIIPEDIVNVVAKLAAIDALGIASEALSAGIASISTSVDGLSESMSLTASAENIIYGAHILQYQKEVDAFFDPAKGAGARSSIRGITCTFL